MMSLEGKPIVPPAGMPDGGARLGVSVARTRGVPLPITQAEADRRRHCTSSARRAWAKARCS